MGTEQNTVSQLVDWINLSSTTGLLTYLQRRTGRGLSAEKYLHLFSKQTDGVWWSDAYVGAIS